MRLLAGLFIAFALILASYAIDREPLVVLPTAIRWRTENSITVIPTDWNRTPLDIEVNITSKQDVPSPPEHLFFDHRSVSDRGAAQTFTFNTSHKPDALEYQISVTITGHKKYSTILLGATNLNEALIQTDKGFYRPGDNIQVRVLPISTDNQLYSSPLKVSLVNPQGFNVITNVVSAENQAIRTTFELSDFATIGFWSITVTPENATLPWMVASTRIRVEEYSLPKFFVTMSVAETDIANEADITIHARYPHGHPVKGSVVVVCGAHTQLAVGDMTDGSWNSKSNLSPCLGALPHNIIRLTATITDRDSDKSVAIREFQPKAPNFQMIPLRPFFDESTRFVKIYFKALLAEAIGNKVECIVTCISTDSNKNGLNSSFATRVEDTLEIEIDSSCTLYLVQANRVVGTRISDEAVLAIPSAANVPQLNLALINPSKKIIYKVGETFEASIPSLMNFVVICNKKDLAYKGAVGINGIINFPIIQSMQGFCMLHVFGSAMNSKKTEIDMWIFFVERSTCSHEFALKSSTKLLRPPGNVTLTVRGPPMSLAVVRGIDEKLYHLVNTFQVQKPVVYWNLDVFAEPSREENAPRLVNFIEPMEVYRVIASNCQNASKRAPINPFATMEMLPEVSDVSNFCAHKFNTTAMFVPRTSPGPLAIQEKNHQVSMGAAVPFFFKAAAKSRPMDAPGTSITLQDSLKVPPTAEPPSRDELFLRTFFPEVWYFNDIRLGAKAEKKIPLEAPHAISKWSFTGTFWSPGEPTTCSVKPLMIETRRHVFMEVDLPSQVYENETIQVKIIVNGDNFVDEKRLSVCFTGLSPVVCGDMGSNGRMAETEYTRVFLNQTQTRSEKFIHLKFLKEGYQNISFELREEVEVIGSDTNHCADEAAAKYDMILKTVKVRRRLDQKEHFRQVSIYPQKRFTEALEATADDQSLQEKTNVIQFKQKILNDNEVETFVNIENDVQIISTNVELSEFDPIFPLSANAEELTLTKRKRREATTDSLSTIMQDYSYTIYKYKQVMLDGVFPEGSLSKGAILNKLQELRSNIFAFSNCTVTAGPCAFGYYGPPVADVSPSILYTATITSLMCEEGVEDALVCGTLTYLKNVAEHGVENFDIDFHGQMSFATRAEEIWFLRVVIKQTFFDCRMRRCMKKFESTDRKLKESFYNFKSNDSGDVRVIGAIATVANQLLAANLRGQIHAMGNYRKIPYWSVPVSALKDEPPAIAIESMDVTANSLALLAFVNQPTDIYHHYRKILDLPRLAEWISEQRSTQKHYPTAIDTFYAWRSLYRYNERATGKREASNVRVQIRDAGFPIREYTNKDMPFSLQLPSQSRNFTLHTIGEGRIVVGVRILATPRKRPKRAESDVPNIQINAIQNRFVQTNNIIIQLVCIKTRSKMLKTLEVDHNIYTGFTTDLSKFELLSNTTATGVKLMGRQRVTVSGLYFVITGITPEAPACYQLVINEPQASYTPEYLAPVTIEARYNQISGQTILTASEITTPIKIRKRRQNHKRNRRNLDASTNLVDTLCEHGTCTCAELSCTAECRTCLRKNDHKALYKNMVKDIKQPGRFGIVATHVSSSSVYFADGNYTRALMKVSTFQEKLISGCAPNLDQFVLWIRSCNKLICTDLVPDAVYILIGSQKGFFEDNVSVTEDPYSNSTQILLQHYLLRDGDRLEGGTKVGVSSDKDAACETITKEFIFFRHSCTLNGF